MIVLDCDIMQKDDDLSSLDGLINFNFQSLVPTMNLPASNSAADKQDEANSTDSPLNNSDMADDSNTSLCKLLLIL